MRHDRLLMRAVHGELNRWGRWVEARLDYEGYPRASATENFKMGDRTCEPGHRVLMLDMPVDVYATDSRVSRLPEELKRIVWTYYVFTLKPVGNAFTTWTFQEKAERLKVPRGTFKQMLYRAKAMIAGLDPNRPGTAESVQVGESVETPIIRPAARGLFSLRRKAN